VTSEPLDVDDLEVAPGGKLLVLSMEVFPGRPRRDEEDARGEGSGEVERDALRPPLRRHWDTWKDGRRNHVFVLPLGVDGKPAGPARDLMPRMDADAPTKPFGGLDDTAVTADGKKLVFTCRDVGREEAWSTNYDLWEVRRTARRPRRRSRRTPPGTPPPLLA